MNKPHALYLHIPFCRRKCHYCDFVVRVLHQSAQIDRYLDHLTLELQALSDLAAPLQTLYIGGGTPSLLESSQIQRLGKILHTAFDLSQLTEATLELNPERADLANLSDWRQLGINRVSVGVQSFDADLLAQCGRSHSLAEIETTVSGLHQAGLHNWSLDLIYGLPGQALHHWSDSLQAAITLQPQHVSLYALEVHPHTHFGHQQLVLPDEDLSADMYEFARATLAQAGFQHYEIANWSLPGFASRHNQVYWQHLPFLAAGVGAHGYWQRRRYANSDSLRAYYAQCLTGDWAWLNAAEQSLSEEIEEYVFLGLRRLHCGLDLADFYARFGRGILDCYPAVLPRLLHTGILIQETDALKLSAEAVGVSNEVFVQLLEPCVV